MSFKFLQAKRIEEEVFSEEEKAELLELAEFLEGLALDLQTIRFEKATLFCTIFIKCFLLSGHSLSDGCLIIETTVNAMMIPPVDIVLGFKG